MAARGAATTVAAAARKSRRCKGKGSVEKEGEGVSSNRGRIVNQTSSSRCREADRSEEQHLGEGRDMVFFSWPMGTSVGREALLYTLMALGGDWASTQPDQQNALKCT